MTVPSIAKSWSSWSILGTASLLLALLPLPGLLASCLGAHPLRPGAIWTGWTLAPEMLLPVVALAVVAQRHQRVTAAWWPTWGVLVIATALLSPLCRLAATLVSVHMLQFMILSIAAPILLARLAGVPRLPPGAWAVAYGAAIWVWHLPPVYTAILDHAVVHLVAVWLLLGISVQFWRSVLATVEERSLAGLAALLMTMAHTGILGAWLTFGARPWYPFLDDSVALWGLTLLEDQQLAGLLMWVAGGLAYLLAALVLCARLLRSQGEHGIAS